MFTTSMENVERMLADGTLNVKEGDYLEVVFPPVPKQYSYVILDHDNVECIKKLYASGAELKSISFIIRNYGYRSKIMGTILEAFENGVGGDLMLLLTGYETPEKVRELYSTLLSK